MLGRDVKEGNAQTAAIQNFLWVMMPKEDANFITESHKFLCTHTHTHTHTQTVVI